MGYDKINYGVMCSAPYVHDCVGGLVKKKNIIVNPLGAFIENI